jgi:hypothetical protein
MLSFRVRGRVVSVLCSELDPSLGEVELKVELDGQHDLDAGYIFRAEGVPGHRLWLVQLPAELYEGRPYLIGLHVRSGERVLESASFSFIGSDRVLHQPVSPPVDTSDAPAEHDNLDSAAPLPPRMPRRLQHRPNRPAAGSGISWGKSSAPTRPKESSDISISSRSSARQQVRPGASC